MHSRNLFCGESDKFAKSRRLVGRLAVDDASFGIGEQPMGNGPGVLVDGTEIAEVLEDRDVGGSPMLILFP